MIIQIPCYVTRNFIQKHPEWIFVYGQDEAQKGCFGQAWECVSEPNAIPVFTCLKMCKSSGFYQDSMFGRMAEANTEQIKKILSFEKPIIPLPKIGEGHSRMKEFAPRSFKWLRSELSKIAHKEIKVIYDT